MTRTSVVKSGLALTLMVALPALAVAQTPKPGAQGSRPGAAGEKARTPAQPSKTPSARVLPQGFSVVLVVADLQATGGQDDVPPAARKALVDMKDFLPYKSYKLLDAAWLLGQGTSGNVTRLRGLDEQEYELRLFAQPTSSPGDGSSRVFVRFTLNDGTAHEHSGETMSSERERARAAEVERQTAALRAELSRAQEEIEKKRQSQGPESEELKAARREHQRLQSEIAASTRASQRRAYVGSSPRASRAVIDTSFAMDVGETVVVGTSRLKGNGKALIALLTAVPPKGRS